MAEAIKAENELPTIKLSLALENLPQDAPPSVQVEFDRGGQVIARLSVQPEDLGIPLDFDPATYQYKEPAFAISEQLLPAFREPVERAMGSDQVLWLQLAPPVGHLAVLPWERMLEPAIGDTPVVRVPNFTLFTPLSVDRIDIVLCVSEPAAKGRLDGIGTLRQLVPSLAESPFDVRVHVFTDADMHAALVAAGSNTEWGRATDRVVLHDPARAPAVAGADDLSSRDAGGALGNPWLLWIADEMRDTTAEVVHFVTDGYVGGGQSAIALPESPTSKMDPLWARFIGPNQIAAFLTQLGAWAVGFTSPPENFSRMGLRQLFDDVAGVRAGPIVYHDVRDDEQAEELAGAYTALFGGHEPSFSRGVSMYAHPGLLATNESPDDYLYDSYADTLLSETLGREFTSAEAPVWETTTRRYLEQSVAQLFPEVQDLPRSEIARAMGEGAERALTFLNEVLSETDEQTR